jgi:hypothetical protein
MHQPPGSGAGCASGMIGAGVSFGKHRGDSGLELGFHDAQHRVTRGGVLPIALRLFAELSRLRARFVDVEPNVAHQFFLGRR